MFANRLHFLSSLGLKNFLFKRSGFLSAPGGKGGSDFLRLCSLQPVGVITVMYFKVASTTNENNPEVPIICMCPKRLRDVSYVRLLIPLAFLLFGLFIPFVSLIHLPATNPVPVSVTVRFRLPVQFLTFQSTGAFSDSLKDVAAGSCIPTFNVLPTSFPD